jgi:hypothetical protein
MHAIHKTSKSCQEHCNVIANYKKLNEHPANQPTPKRSATEIRAQTRNSRALHSASQCCKHYIRPQQTVSMMMQPTVRAGIAKTYIEEQMCDQTPKKGATERAHKK